MTPLRAALRATSRNITRQTLRQSSATPLSSSSSSLRTSALPSSTLPFSTTSVRPTTDNPTPASDPQSANKAAPTVSASNAVPTSSVGAFDAAVQEGVQEGEEMRVMQAPNRKGIWSPGQRAREDAMVGPRFEQMIQAHQPRPLAAIELIHKQPVNWTKERIVSCDGGGGPLGHPRIFINVDKPQVCACTYCGLPYAHEHHRKHLEAQDHTPYPLEPLESR